MVDTLVFGQPFDLHTASTDLVFPHGDNEIAIAREAQAMGLALPEIEVGVRTGDTPSAERARHARRPPHVMITTPESLYLLLTSSSAARMFATTRAVIIDEEAREYWRADGCNSWLHTSVSLDLPGTAKFIRALTLRYNAMVDELNQEAEAIPPLRDAGQL